MSHIYMSFTDPDLPKGQQWLGGCIVPADSGAEALTMSHLLGCNPGGQIAFCEVPEHVTLKPDYVGRLLNRQEIEDAVEEGKDA